MKDVEGVAKITFVIQGLQCNSRERTLFLRRSNAANDPTVGSDEEGKVEPSHFTQHPQRGFERQFWSHRRVSGRVDLTDRTMMSLCIGLYETPTEHLLSGDATQDSPHLGSAFHNKFIEYTVPFHHKILPEQNKKTLSSTTTPCHFLPRANEPQPRTPTSPLSRTTKESKELVLPMR